MVRNLCTFVLRMIFKTYTMKNMIAAAALLLTLAACNGGNKATLENTQWKLVKAGGIPAEAINREADFFTMTFDAQQQMVAGRTNCNRFFGHYKVTGREIDFENMGMTRMACPEMEYETMFAHILDEADRFEVRGHELRLFDDKKEIAVFKAVTADAKAAEKKATEARPAATAPAGADSVKAAMDASKPADSKMDAQKQMKKEERLEKREERKEMREAHKETAGKK